MGISNMDDSSNDETLYQLADLFKVFGDQPEYAFWQFSPSRNYVCRTLQIRCP